MKVLVTGASGFIGARLCRALSCRGVQVVASARRRCDVAGSEFLAWDMANPSRFPMPHGVDCVVHLASRVHAAEEAPGEAEACRCVIVDGTNRLVAAAVESGVPRFVYISSVKAMGEYTGIEAVSEDAPAKPVTPYGRGKLDAEQIVLGARFQRACVLRLPMVYGVGAKGNLPSMIDAVRGGFFPPLPRIRNVRSMIHCDDVVDAIVLMIQSEGSGGSTFIACERRGYSTTELYDGVRDSLGLGAPMVRVPLGILRVAARLGDVGGRLRGRRLSFDSRQLDKLIRSAFYSPATLEAATGWTATRNLLDSLPAIVRSRIG